MNKNTINVPVLAETHELLPVYASDGAAGADVKASIQDEIQLLPGKAALIPTGLRFEIPEGYEIQVRPRSGLALKHQITVLNTPGTIDEDYRGEVKVILINHGTEVFTITPGMRIAQIVLAEVSRAKWIKIEDLAESVRGANGFGHTGYH